MSEINCFVDVNKGKLSFMLSMDSEVTWKMFTEEMSKYLTDFDLVNRLPRYSYEDEDGDRVFFESDLELKEALSYAASQELFIILVDAAEKEVPQAVPSAIPSSIPSSIPQEVPQQFEDLSDVVNVLGKALQKELPQIANVIENVLGDKEALQNNLNSAAKFISQFCEEEKDDIEKFVEEFLPGLVKVPKQKKCKEQKKPKAKKVVKKNVKKQPKEKVIHHAICDYCSKHIEGIRYKCLQCPDYDLCENCESVNCKNKFHDEDHVFAKIVKPLRSPVAPHPHFAARMRGQCPARFERVRSLEDKVQNLENELAQIKALLLNNNNNQQAPVENLPEPIPEVSTEQQQEEVAPQPIVEQQPVEPSFEEQLTEEERECFEQLKAMGFDVHSSIVSENNADLSLILEKLL